MNIDERCYGYEPASKQLKELRLKEKQLKTLTKKLGGIKSNLDGHCEFWELKQLIKKFKERR